MIVDSQARKAIDYIVNAESPEVGEDFFEEWEKMSPDVKALSNFISLHSIIDSIARYSGIKDSEDLGQHSPYEVSNEYEDPYGRTKIQEVNLYPTYVFEKIIEQSDGSLLYVTAEQLSSEPELSLEHYLAVANSGNLNKFSGGSILYAARIGLAEMITISDEINPETGREISASAGWWTILNGYLGLSSDNSYFRTIFNIQDAADHIIKSLDEKQDINYIGLNDKINEVEDRSMLYRLTEVLPLDGDSLYTVNLNYTNSINNYLKIVNNFEQS